MQGSNSEIAQIRQRIAEEIAAMYCGFSGIATGMARHDFIQVRMERIGNHQEELAKYVGPTDAADIVCKIYINVDAS